jgi:nitrogen fixation-related uncharacterized protein
MLLIGISIIALILSLVIFYKSWKNGHIIDGDKKKL